MLILVGLAVCLPAFVGEVASEAPREAATASGRDEIAEGSRFVAYYFHGNRRCKTCRTIEDYAEKAVKRGFKKELKSGLLQWQVVNMEQPENEHFVKDFSLASAALVVVEMKNGKPARHQTLQDVWLLTNDEEKFRSYVDKAIRDFLG
jgi:hypothetical protein